MGRIGEKCARFDWRARSDRSKAHYIGSSATSLSSDNPNQIHKIFGARVLSPGWPHWYTLVRT